MLRRVARTCLQTTSSRAFTARVELLPHTSSSYSTSPQPSEDASAAQSRVNNVANALKDTKPADNNLLSPVHIPEDPHGVIKERHPATSILANSAIVIQRELEMMNIMMGFEQANKYVIHDPQGNHIGYMAEQELGIGIGSTMRRQFLTTHRPFTTHIFDRSMKEVLRFHRPFTWISSRIKVYDPVEVSSSSLSSSTSLETPQAGALSPHLSGTSPDISPLAMSDMRIIGEAQRQWAPLRRKYNLFLLRSSTSPSPPVSQSPSDAPPAAFEQFAYISERFLSWDFSLLSSSSKLLGSVNRNFTNFGREIFTDAGCYALRMDAAGLAEEPGHLISKSGEMPTVYEEEGEKGMSLDQRAVMLATAVSIDFDYFSPSRGGMFGGMFPPFMMGGAPAEGATAGEAGAAGAAGGVAAGDATGATAAAEARGMTAAGQGGLVSGSAEGDSMVQVGATSAATMAGYDAVQRRVGRGEQGGQAQGQYGDATSPIGAWDPYGDAQQGGQGVQGQNQGQEEVWGEEWGWDGKEKGGNAGGSGSDGGGEGDGGDGGGFDVGDWF
ncbi:MAG: hypothetical protein MMC23_007111 [Stictis urceolatum]|nr:hypothetical protein [Stictis urceolata]